MNCRSKYQFNRVNHDVPCPVCLHDHWCMISQYGERAVCCRVESDWPAPAFSGWYHQIPPRGRPSPARIAAVTKPVGPHQVRDFGDLHQQHLDWFDSEQKTRAAASLGLDPCVFDLYPIGYAPTLDSLAIPAMQVTSPKIVGIRYRRIGTSAGGSKWMCQPESTAGLLLPTSPPTSGHAICLLEGPSDTLAAGQIGLHAIGRWSCGLDSRQAETLKYYLADCEQPTIFVIGDNDALHTGEKGADAAAELVTRAIPGAVVLRVQPPMGTKDLREWVVDGGASAADVLDAGKEVRRGS